MITEAQLLFYQHEVESKHKPDLEQSGCTCGFCVWSTAHVLSMYRLELEKLLEKEEVSCK